MMDLLVYLLAFSLFIKFSSCIRCYKCEEDKNDGTLPCREFDGSDKFIVDCEHSTMCFQRNTTASFEIDVTVIQRGCAKQTLDGDQRRVNGKWTNVYNVYEVYNEGCTEDKSDPNRIVTKINCYCRGNLCNDSVRNQSRFSSLILLFIILLFINIYFISKY